MARKSNLPDSQVVRGKWVKQRTGQVPCPMKGPLPSLIAVSQCCETHELTPHRCAEYDCEHHMQANEELHVIQRGEGR